MFEVQTILHRFVLVVLVRLEVIRFLTCSKQLNKHLGLPCILLSDFRLFCLAEQSVPMWTLMSNDRVKFDNLRSLL